MTIIYAHRPFGEVKQLAAEKGLDLVYHPLQGATFLQNGQVVGMIEGNDTRKFLAFVLQFKPNLEYIINAILDAGLDVEIFRTAPGTHHVRLWRDGDVVVETEAKKEPGEILAAMMDTLREKGELR